mmetsp:Transcript_59493/g.154629  ORF Transcript_59493/g.154629 Transcript_59493/m.154629 type:complete len:238 (+) Transcript_59493:713-1426(+)
MRRREGEDSQARSVGSRARPSCCHRGQLWELARVSATAHTCGAARATAVASVSSSTKSLLQAFQALLELAAHVQRLLLQVSDLDVPHSHGFAQLSQMCATCFGEVILHEPPGHKCGAPVLGEGASDHVLEARALQVLLQRAQEQIIATIRARHHSPTAILFMGCQQPASGHVAAALVPTSRGPEHTASPVLSQRTALATMVATHPRFLLQQAAHNRGQRACRLAVLFQVSPTHGGLA